jgi:hypothetical protein
MTKIEHMVSSPNVFLDEWILLVGHKYNVLPDQCQQYIVYLNISNTIYRELNN